MRASGGTTMRLSPPLYLTVSTWPSTPFTVSATVAFVMVPCGARSHGRKPSPRPRWLSANTVTRMARWLPSAFGVAPTPMKAPGLTSASVVVATPNTLASGVSVTLLVPPPSSARTVIELASAASIVPVTRMVVGAKGCARTGVENSASAKISGRIGTSHRGRQPASNIHCFCQDRPVRLLVPAEDDDLRAGLEFAGVALGRGRDRRLRRDDDRLLPVLVFDLERFAVLGGDGALDIGIGHGAARPRIPRAGAVRHDAALRRQEDMNGKGLDAAVRPRHAGDADEGVRLDIGERGL